jgi:exopolysaccharide biosynthesis polyprenyl glycosylphosphotransferase
MKRSELFFSFILLPLDFLMFFLAAISAYYLRFTKIATDIRPVNFNLSISEYTQIALPIALLWLAIFAMAGLYRIKGAIKSFGREFYRIILACSTGLVLIVILIFLRRELFDSRFIVLAAWILSIIYITLERSMVRVVQRIMFKYGIGTHKVVIVGSSKSSDILIQEFSSNRAYGYDVAKRLRDFSIETANDLAEYIKMNEIDEILQSDPNLNKAELLRLYDFADDHHITFKYAADLLGTKVLQTEVMDIAGIPVVEVKKTPLDGWGRIIKRSFDIIVSFIIIIILSPLMLVTALLIKLDSYGPIFFSRKDDGTQLFRVGQGGKLIRYFKFRSMIPGADGMRYNELAERNVRKGGPMVKIKDDPRVTRIGRFIRRFSIDELPELFLVLKGDMSLVGPRPHLPEEVARYEHHHKKVLTIKPGITGFAQVSGRSDLSFEDEVKLDTYYIENWSLFMDITILLKTPLAVLQPRDVE